MNKKIEEIIEKIDNLIKDIYREGINPYIRFLEIYPYIKNFYEEFYELIPQLNAIGLVIETERLLKDMRNLSEAIEKKDKVLLFDTLNYEVKETLGWYKQIKAIMEEDNV